MDKQKIEIFLGVNGDKFAPYMIPSIKEKMEAMDDDKSYILNSASFYNPTLILVIAILLGWERFFLNDVALGILKVITCYGLGIWWLVDLFTAVERTHKYNYNKFMQLSSY